VQFKKYQLRKMLAISDLFLEQTIMTLKILLICIFKDNSYKKLLFTELLES